MIILHFRQLLASYEGLVKYHASMQPFRLFVIEQNNSILHARMKWTNK